MRVACLNIVFYLLFVLASSIVIPALALYITLVSLSGSRRRTMRQLRRAIGWYGTVVLHLPFPWVRIDVEDMRRDVGSGPCIYACNHRSMSDPFLMAFLYWTENPIEVVQVVNIWPFKIPVLGALARLAGYLSVNEMTADEFFARAAAYLEDGISIACFPEGTRSGGREMGPFHGSAFRLALRTGVPVVPVCIVGNERIPPRGSLVLHPGTVRIRMLPAITRTDYADMTPFQLKTRVWEVIAGEMRRMEGGRSETV